MLNLQVRTKLTPKQVMERAQAFFGAGGLGLKMNNKSDNCVSFEGGGGGVEVTTCTDDEGTSVFLEARELVYQASEFAGEIK